MTKNTIKAVAETISYILVTAVICLLLQRLLSPKYAEHPREGAMMAEYYGSEVSHDVIFLGDCEIYEGISPIRLWEGYGITSYVRGSPQQLAWQSYYVLRDTLEHETPKVVVFNAACMVNAEASKEAYNRLTIDGIRSMRFRLAAARASKKDEEDKAVSYAVPLLRYHSRWSDLGEADFKYFLQNPELTHAGYLMQTGVDPQTAPYFARPCTMRTLPEKCVEYLLKTAELCREKDITFVLYKAPTKSWQYPWYDVWDESLERLAAEHGFTYVNGLDHVDDMGLDMTTDTYDKGIHLNVSGAEKCSDYIAPILTELGALEDHRGEAETAEKWAKLCARYHESR